MSKIHILKFGGTSLQNSAFIKQAVELVKNKASSVRPVIVVSAIAGVTDQLITLSELSPDQEREAKNLIDGLKKLHCSLLLQLGGATAECYAKLESLFAELEEVFLNAEFRNNRPKAWRDHILSIGERASASIFASALSAQQLASIPVEAQQYIKTDATFGEANILSDATRKHIVNAIGSLQEIAVITGFIGSTEQQEITTLGRSGSDFTAGIVAEALNAEQLEIWTDVDGVLTADPNIVPEAQNIKYLSFKDISELSAHGAKVIHPKTMLPIKDSDITVLVRNSYQPENPGTVIKRDHTSNGDFRSITVTGPFVSFNVPDGYSKEVIELISQQEEGKLEPEEFRFLHTSGFESAQFVIKESLLKFLESSIQHWAKKKGLALDISKNLFRINTFANRLQQDDKVAAHIIQLLSTKNINPLSWSREHGKRYFSLLLPEAQTKDAAKIINRYLLTDTKTVHLFVAGIGTVGGKLLNLIGDYSKSHLKLKVIGLCNSSKTLWDKQGLKTNSPDKLLDGGAKTNWGQIVQRLKESDRHNTIFVDATGSEEVASHYHELLEAGVHIATPSKIANTSEQAYYNLLKQKVADNKASFRYETTVGAGLPIISTIQNLVESGDTITELSGVVSGTMTYLFNELENGTAFSQAVIKARKLGYAEPDPRDDLSGEDVARKFLTLARETGLSVERGELEVESLIPDELKDVDRSTFLERLQEFDNLWEKKIQHAKSKGETLRYTGKLKNGTIRIGVEQLPQNSSLGQLKETDNLLRIHSSIYSQTPIIIQGPGAGREVTAAGLLSDILKIAQSLTV